jgi:hypothetical protein
MTESRQHLELKQLAAQAAEKDGWNARFEVSETNPSGKRWIADVLLEKDGRRVAIEAQWSAQSSFDFRKRQVPYREACVETIWLHRNRVLPGSPDVVECYVEEIAVGQYNASLTGYLGASVPDDPANISVMAAETKCWRDGCDGRFPAIASLFFSFGRPDLASEEGSLNFSLAQLDPTSEAAGQLAEMLRRQGGWDHLKERFSNIIQTKYLSCGCPKCDSLFGDHFALQYIYDAKPVARFRAPIPPNIFAERFEDSAQLDVWTIW